MGGAAQAESVGAVISSVLTRHRYRACVVSVACASLACADAAAAAAPRATFSPPVVSFGDRFTAVVSADQVPSDAQVQADLAPLEELSTPKLVVRDGVLRWSVAVACLDQVCAGARVVVPLKAARILAGGRTISVPWPQLVVRGRVSKQDLTHDPPPLVADTSVPPVSYRVRPGALAAWLDVLAIVLAIAGVTLGARQAVLLSRERDARAARQTQLERALVLAREARTRDPADRRRAVGLLARLLARRGEPIAAPAADLAWSPPVPRPEEIDELVSDVERELQT
jgi:hypothetical protein